MVIYHAETKNRKNEEKDLKTETDLRRSGESSIEAVMTEEENKCMWTIRETGGFLAWTEEWQSSGVGMTSSESAEEGDVRGKLANQQAN